MADIASLRLDAMTVLASHRAPNDPVAAFAIAVLEYTDDRHDPSPATAGLIRQRLKESDVPMHVAADIDQLLVEAPWFEQAEQIEGASR